MPKFDSHRTFTVDLNSVDAVCAFMHGLGVKSVYLDIVLDEIVRNIVLHSGLKQHSEFSVTCELLNNSDVKVIFRDKGKAFNPAAASQNSFGIRLIQRLVDSLAYERSEDHNILTITTKIVK